jgi:hypothetical protein
MKRIPIAVALVLSLVAAPAFAELRELKQSIYGMD